MARFERAARPASGPLGPAAGPHPAVKMRLGADGAWHPVQDERPTVAETEAAPRPAQAPDPRSGPLRDVPPYGAG
jgi:hypothetical protein